MEPHPNPPLLIQPTILNPMPKEGGTKNFRLKISCRLKFFWTHNFFGPQIFLDPKFFWIQNFFLTQNFLAPNFFLTQIFFQPKTVFNSKYLGPKIFWPKIFLDPKFQLNKEFDSSAAQLVVVVVIFSKS